MKMYFKRCKRCGQIVGVINDTGVPMICCGEVMEIITPKEDEKDLNEKHIPKYERFGNKVIVRVGDVPHPSTLDHHIEWIAICTTSGNQRKNIKVGDVPTVKFMLEDGEKIVDIYSYCNLHSLWVNHVNEK